MPATEQVIPEQLSEAVFAAGWRTPEGRVLLEILNSIHESILIINADTRVCYVNDSYLKMFSIRREKIIGRHLVKFEPLARIHEVLKKGVPLTGDISHIHSAQMDVCADIVPLCQDGKTIGALALMKNMTELVRANRELEHFRTLSRHLQDELHSKDSLPPGFRNVLGHSKAFVGALQIAAKAAPSEASVCITGESGTGKEVVAEALHRSSGRAGGPLIKINCAAIPEPLLESELFGYEGGAFTGARSGGKPGKFELAKGGTLFLDEIGEMPLSMQVKLLRALQEREITRVGGTKPTKLDFRLITATNRDLEAMAAEGTFREDLFYRISVIPVALPPLRQRREDIGLYASYFLEELGRQYGRAYRISEEALDLLERYHWPGNVRELKNCMERAAVLTLGDTVSAEQLPAKLQREELAGSRSHSPGQRKLRELLDETERRAIENALRLCGNNRTQAMELLGISRRNFYQKLEKYQLN
ncbi:MAG: sigma 54-interacting transcriptional regulator [Oscillospiraceae bacterium]|nr:sigma 54-interacting transcriptional regulator [Oscillospiraceae bacterium]